MTPAGLVVVMTLLVQMASELPELLLPPDDGAWVVRVETSGGFTGRGAGHYTASSAGSVLCVAVRFCPDRLVPERREALARLVSALPRTLETPASPSLPSSTCADCVTMTVTVRQRTREGERTLRYSWDVSTVTTIPEEVRRLQTAMQALVSR